MVSPTNSQQGYSSMVNLLPRSKRKPVASGIYKKILKRTGLCVQYPRFALKKYTISLTWLRNTKKHWLPLSQWIMVSHCFVHNPDEALISTNNCVLAVVGQIKSTVTHALLDITVKTDMI
ncbi:CGH_3_collapsed_G0015130.mRNA.1.CDS.1 [Saccharomyces cerevisiae]|nr:CGH_3_collapsed_G0015130.mRNA.1.CDS.1 [Saccharomyces cerevisiae]